MIAGDDPRPWQLVHDGTIVRAERDLNDAVALWIECAYLRGEVYPDGGTAFVFRLAGCTRAVYTPYDEPPIEDLAALAASEPDIATVEVRGDDVHVWGGAGELVVRCTGLAIELDTGRAVALADVEAAAKAYWDRFRAANPT